MEYKEFAALIQKALDYIKIYHADQKYGNSSYLVHLSSVQEILVEFGYYPDSKNPDLGYKMMIAALLHDILEDTKLTYQELEQDFGSDITKLVWRVTDESGKNRKERHAKTYPKTREDSNAVALKLADRLANVRYAIKTKSQLIEMYKKEWIEFKQELQTIDEHSALWKALDEIFN